MNKKIVILILASLLSACGGGSSAPAVPVPQNVVVTNDGADVTVSWGLLDGVDGYHLYYAHEPIVSVSSIAAHTGGMWLENVVPPVTFTVADPDPVHHIVVTAAKGSRESRPSNEVIAVTRYTVSADGQTVTDSSTGYVWDRCLYGQTWDVGAGECVGTVEILELEEVKQVVTDTGTKPQHATYIKTLIFCSSGQPAYFPYDKTTSAMEDRRCQGDFNAPTIHPLLSYDSHMSAMTTTSCGGTTYIRPSFSTNGSVGVCAGGSGAAGPIRLYED